MTRGDRPRDRGNHVMNFEVTPEQRDQIKLNAEWFGMTVAGFLRHAALGGTVERKRKR